MWKDPVVEEVRAVRERQARALNFDVKKIVAQAKRKQRKSGRRLVSFAGSKDAPAGTLKSAR